MIRIPEAGPSPILNEIAEIANDPLHSERLHEDPLGTARWLLEHSLESGDYTKSLLNAHEKGLHSVMLYDFGPGQGKVRMFLAEGGEHDLGNLKDAEDDLRCRIHDHRFNLALVPIVGDVLQISADETDDPDARSVRTKYEFGSAILSAANKFTFKSLGERAMTDDVDEILTPKGLSLMTADQLHSVNTTPEHSESDVAWLVIEGVEERSSSVLYSVAPDLPFSQNSEGLYIPATGSESAGLVGRALNHMKGK